MKQQRTLKNEIEYDTSRLSPLSRLDKGTLNELEQLKKHIASVYGRKRSNFTQKSNKGGKRKQSAFSEAIMPKTALTGSKQRSNFAEA